ncbi:hypothetical protein GUJ93_ZPchr0002g23746 [Zizania palustris]|uniref:2Fe-2S ferredoxin-type domain-containing protein n=1 Tax=Zizania palustris TaxID=103762 RepID=A0A8J5V3G8_ZIZPA|nr:hypothetical protein GUJ93_ZPchr0002g23746 [Zizania palustris]
MLARISRLGIQAMRRATPGQNSLNDISRRHLVEAVTSHVNHMGKTFFCSNTSATSNDRSNELEAKISVTFIDKDGEEKLVKVPIGMSMLEAAHENDIELEGACEGSLACSTCHVIVTDVNYYNKLEDPVDEENDMLDLAFGLTETSRLGCQIIKNASDDNSHTRRQLGGCKEMKRVRTETGVMEKGVATKRC